jgi:pimeloyl-ACP methyl ester carboxylesterase
MGGASMKITERAVLIGPRKSLVGVVTQPGQPDMAAPAVILVNGGILPRWGRSRIYVTLARRLAGLGHRVLRFDLSGIGDSPSRSDGLPPTEAAVADVGDAVDWLVGPDAPVIIIGLCDGANLAAYQASIDRRVVGAVLLDPLIPRTFRYRLTHLWRRVKSPTAWRELVTGAHPLWRFLGVRARRLARGDQIGPVFDPNDPQIRSILTRMYQSIVDNEVELLAIFSGGMQHRHCYREQLFDAFPTVAFNERLILEYFPANDHHFEWPPHRAWLLDRLLDWITTAPFRELDVMRQTNRDSMADEISASAAD